jgi:predicted Zn-dependent protease
MVLNSKGIRAHQTYTAANMSNIVMHPTFSGYSGFLARDINSMNMENLADIAVGKVLKGINPKDIEPGKYDVILEPTAFGELIEWLNYIGLNSRCMEDGTGFMYGHIGEKIVGENISLYDDAYDPKGMCAPFDFEGVPKQKVFFIENGVAKGVVHDTYSGAKAKVKSTGHSLGAAGMAHGAMAMNIFLKPGSVSVDDMIRSMERGILVTRLHYVNGMLHTPTAKMTGMTRDGAFWVEKGEIKYGIKNMRFTDSVVRMLNNIKMISKETLALPAWWGATGAYVLPAVYVKDFEFTGKSDH